MFVESVPKFVHKVEEQFLADIGKSVVVLLDQMSFKKATSPIVGESALESIDDIIT